MKRITLSILSLFFILFKSQAQTLTSEDSLSISGKNAATYIGGYGNAYYHYDSNQKQALINLERAVLFIGHRFNDKFSFLSEIEIEDAKVSGGEEGGEVAIEQAYLKFTLSRNSYLTAGLFLPRIGILNENHLPNTFNGNERTRIESLLIPSTWRELGVGFYTSLNNFPVELSFALINGLNCAGFEHGNLIRGGRAEGREATANNLALTGAVKYQKNNLVLQLSAYAGGSVGLSATEARILNLSPGPFGTPVMLTEGNIQYKINAFSIKALATIVLIPDAEKINNVFSNNTPEMAYGIYGEAAYNFLFKDDSENKRSLFGFLRYEKFDLNATVPKNAVNDPVMDQQHIVLGLSYLPIPQIAVKADVRFAKTGKETIALPVNPDPLASPHKTNNTFINIGFGFSF